MACLSVKTQHNLTTDQSALLALKAHITSDPNSQFLLNNWSVASPVCDWYGVTCDSRYSRVISLNISDMSLAGVIPPQIANLSFLASLDLSYNDFQGDLSHDLSGLR